MVIYFCITQVESDCSAQQYPVGKVVELNTDKGWYLAEIIKVPGPGAYQNTRLKHRKLFQQNLSLTVYLLRSFSVCSAESNM